MKTYKSNVVLSTIIFLICSVAISLVTNYVFSKYVPFFYFRHKFLTYIVIFLEIVILVYITKIFIITIEVNVEGITFKRGKHKYLVFKFSEYEVTPSIYRFNYNGFVHTSRFLNCKGKYSEKRFKCYNFTKNIFSEMSAYILSIQNGEYKQNDGYDFYTICKKFVVPQKKISNSFRKNPFFLISIIIFLIFLVTGILSVYRNLTNFFMAMFMPFVTGIVSLVFIFKEISIRKQIPSEIRIYPSKIDFDSKTFEFKNIKKIIATNPQHTGNYQINRRLTICSSDSTKDSYVFGVQTNLKTLPSTFLEYEEMCVYLQKVLGDKFQFDL